MNRREFLNASGSCLGYLGFFAATMPSLLAQDFGRRAEGEIVQAESWGRIEKLGEGVWACISTPLAGGSDAMRTFCNGGIVAGRTGVVVVEGFASDAGARWIADIAERVTNRRPTHVVLTHYHGDHSAGLGGYQQGGSGVGYLTTAVTRDLLRPSRQAVAEILGAAELVTASAPTVIDLGGRRVTIISRSGHTPSDLSVAVDDPPTVFAGDLIWNGLFPNYVDALPSVLSREVRALVRDDRWLIVPGHGSRPDRGALSRYLGLLDFIEDAAKRGFVAGRSAEETARDLVLPPSLGEWKLFGETYYQVALRAWERELRR
jgi:glyoxylase-like metal-dependent hydrolase (beta-lactamase superfamily II)